MTVNVGDAAPDFTLPGTGGRSYTLSELRGRPVVLAFYPGDNSPVCTLQLNSYTRDIEQLEQLHAQVFAISPQSVASHEDFSAKQGGFAFPLLADEDKSVGAAYGILGPLGFYRRSIFVIAADGTVKYAHRSVTGAGFKRTEVLRDAILRD